MDSGVFVTRGAVSPEDRSRLDTGHTKVQTKVQKTWPLAKWRLRRTIGYIESHIDSPLSLRDLARTAGLSRMHFAAQFRQATGVRPHSYLLGRRVEKAQILLATTDMPIVAIALEVGFSSQAHFTVVFKRFCGWAPRQWRREKTVASSCDKSNHPISQ